MRAGGQRASRWPSALPTLARSTIFVRGYAVSRDDDEAEDPPPSGLVVAGPRESRRE